MTETKTETSTKFEHKNLWEALAAFQEELPQVVKDKSANTGKFAYSYADLATLAPIIIPALAWHGLVWVTWTEIDERGVFLLRYKLRHVTGDAINGVYPLPQDARPQELGSALTYAKRYALLAVTGVAPADDDDDAIAAQARPYAGRITQAQADAIVAEFDRLNISSEAGQAAIDWASHHRTVDPAELTSVEAGRLIGELTSRPTPEPA